MVLVQPLTTRTGRKLVRNRNQKSGMRKRRDYHRFVNSFGHGVSVDGPFVLRSQVNDAIPFKMSRKEKSWNRSE